MTTNLEEVALAILKAGAVEIRDIDAGAEPFIYSTGNRGPGYVMIKGLVGQPAVLKLLTKALAQRVVKDAKFDFIEGNATGGMVPAWQLRNDVSELLGREVAYCYLRGSRKEGGHGELITGDRNNPLIQKGMAALVVEELVNYAGTTTNAAEEFRRAGYPVSHAACILSYDHPESNQRIKEANLNLIALITLPQLLDVAESSKYVTSQAAKSYRDFLKDPLGWQLVRKLAIPDGTAQEAMKRGFNLRRIALDEAEHFGLPSSKVAGQAYWVQD